MLEHISCCVVVCFSAQMRLCQYGLLNFYLVWVERCREQV